MKNKLFVMLMLSAMFLAGSLFVGRDNSPPITEQSQMDAIQTLTPMSHLEAVTAVNSDLAYYDMNGERIEVITGYIEPARDTGDTACVLSYQDKRISKRPDSLSGHAKTEFQLRC